MVEAETVTRIGSTIPNMLAVSDTGGFAEGQAGRAVFPQVRGVILEKALEYLHWHRQHSTPGNNASRFAPTDFERRIPPEMVLELYVLTPCSAEGLSSQAARHGTPGL